MHALGRVHLPGADCKAHRRTGCNAGPLRKKISRNGRDPNSGPQRARLGRRDLQSSLAVTHATHTPGDAITDGIPVAAADGTP